MRILTIVRDDNYDLDMLWLGCGLFPQRLSTGRLVPSVAVVRVGPSYKVMRSWGLHTHECISAVSLEWVWPPEIGLVPKRTHCY